MVPKEQCLDCAGRRKDLEEVRNDYYPFKESMIGKSNWVLGSLSVVGVLFVILMFFVRFLNTEVGAMETKTDTVFTDVAVIKEQIKNINTKLDSFEKGQGKVIDKLQEIIDEM